MHLTAETITNLNPLTPLPILRLFRPAGTLDGLAGCTSLTSVDLTNTYLEGTLDALANCTALVKLILMYCNKLTGTLDALANCKNLKELNCYECRGLSGPCPRPAASKSPT